MKRRNIVVQQCGSKLGQGRRAGDFSPRLTLRFAVKNVRQLAKTLSQAGYGNVRFGRVYSFLHQNEKKHKQRLELASIQIQPWAVDRVGFHLFETPHARHEHTQEAQSNRQRNARHTARHTPPVNSVYQWVF